ncbi:hypothetical protein M9R32_08795 [Paenisporosarcina quisquiliarum]|uniref:Uncharacterized protein n=1 Tax=Paenisporosarcina quisquiliarum TaxID=365346 RepID=A0A9X3LFX7_9BACL|nr:hypothetical protein [Paenisporosarcina quisquiliarum]MCZ8537275.1 hypothetical protein [Paenisporosarcina quisquiliarum]
MQTALVKALIALAIYTAIVLILALFGLNENMPFDFWLFPLQIIIILDLGHPLESFSPERELLSLIVNVLFIYMAHFLSSLPKQKYIRVILNTLTATIVVGWYLFLMFVMVAVSAG